MVEINLLPWRVHARAEEAKKRKIFIYSFGMLLFFWVVIEIIFNSVLQGFDSRISDLQNALTELSSQTDDNHFSNSLPIIEQIHSSQRAFIHLFKNIDKEIPEAVDWSQLSSQKNHIVMTGKADSVLMLSQFVRSYNVKNKAYPMVVLSVKNDDISYSTLFRLQLIRVVLPFLNQLKNDDAS